MTNEEKLRALLAEAQYGLRTYTKDDHGGRLSNGATEWLADVHQRIDAALAEPVATVIDWRSFFLTAERERDEARAEVERLRLVIVTCDTAWIRRKEQGAYQRGAEAMREAAEAKAFTTLSLHDEPCPRSELRSAVTDAIRALPIPEDTP